MKIVIIPPWRGRTLKYMVKNKTDYSILLIVATLYLALIWHYQTSPKYVLFSTVIFALVYLVWGVIHHLKSKSFHARIMLEYLLVASLGIAIISTLLL